MMSLMITKIKSSYSTVAPSGLLREVNPEGAYLWEKCIKLNRSLHSEKIYFNRRKYVKSKL